MSSFSLAPDAASHSLKRARELFDKSASSAFLPSVDEELHEIAIARRLRTQYNQKKVVDATINQKKKSEEGAIVVSSKQLHGVDDGKTEVFTVPSNTSTSGVLARLPRKKKSRRLETTRYLSQTSWRNIYSNSNLACTLATLYGSFIPFGLGSKCRIRPYE